MKRTEFKQYFLDRLTILKINIIEKLLIDLSSVFETWASIIFGFIWVVFYLIFINVLYLNVNSIAGYSRDEMLFFGFIAQIAFFLIITFSTESLQELIISVKTGNLDLVLSKPMPSLFYVLFKRIDVTYFISTLIPSITPFFFIINWSKLNFSFSSIVAGILIVILGQIALSFFQFVASIPVFWRGSAEQILSLSWVFEYNLGRVIPLQGLDKAFQGIFMTVIPVMISTALSTSVFLNKSDIGLSLLLAFVVAVLTTVIKIYLWKLCLRSYSSASS